MAIDPLSALPAEIVLRVLHFATLSSVAQLSAVSKSWNGFLEKYQEPVFSALTTHHPKESDPSTYRHGVKSFSKYFDDTTSWKDLCKKQTLLQKNWGATQPTTTQSIFEIGTDYVWRFRPDFKRRFFVSTSQRGGIRVTCMDTGARLWELSANDVRPYAHLEYNEVNGRGVAVWDRWGNAVEVWRTVEEDGAARGTFEQVAVLNHDCETRGYQLSFNTLCVVSTQGQAFVYDMIPTPPTLTTHLEIEDEAVGHLDQDADYVMFSLGSKGYHVHEKVTGRFVGAIEPWRCSPKNLYHIPHPQIEDDGLDGPRFASRSRDLARSLLQFTDSNPVFPPSKPNRDRLVPLVVDHASEEEDDDYGGVESMVLDDDWGAGMISGSSMVGVSRGSRVIVVRNWRDCLTHINEGGRRNETSFATNASLLVCAAHRDPRSFDMGGWLSIHNDRVLFEVRECVYIVSLDDVRRGDDDDIGQQEEKKKHGDNNPTGAASSSSLSGNRRRIKPSSYAANKSSTTFASPVPVSFMALYDDCIMHTHTMFGRRGLHPDENGDRDDEEDDNVARLYPTKGIRVISLAPVATDDDG